MYFSPFLTDFFSRGTFFFIIEFSENSPNTFTVVKKEKIHDYIVGGSNVVISGKLMVKKSSLKINDHILTGVKWYYQPFSL